jgi:hypothetical protein
LASNLNASGSKRNAKSLLLFLSAEIRLLAFLDRTLAFRFFEGTSPVIPVQWVFALFC